MAEQLATLQFFSPAIVAKNERNLLRLFVYGTGGSMATVSVYVVPPRGSGENINSIFVDVSASFPATFLSQFEAEYTFQEPGLYTFIVHDSASGDVWIDKTYCSEWASKIDIPVSDVLRQRSDIQRIYNKIGR